MKRRVQTGLLAALALLVLAVVLTLLESPPDVLRSNGVPVDVVLASTTSSARTCQAGEVVPAGTSAVRMTLGSELGPELSLAGVSAGRTVFHGHRGGGWTGASVTVPVDYLSHTIADVQVCFTPRRATERLLVLGHETSSAVAITASDGEKLGGRMSIEYLRGGSASWLSQIPSIARRIGLGHAWAGTWVVFVLLAAMSVNLFLICRFMLRELS